MDYGAVIDQADAASSSPSPSSSGLPPLPPAPGGARAPNPYAAVIDRADEDTVQQAQGLAWANRDADPNKAGRALALSQQTGVPSTVVEQNLPEFEQRSALARNAQILQGNPVLAQWLLANPPALRAARDDFDNLDAISKLGRSLAAGWTAGQLQYERGNIGNLEQLGLATPENQARLGQVEQQLQQQPAPGGIYGFAKSGASFFSGLLDNALVAVGAGVASAGAGAAGGAALGSLAGGVGAGPGAAAGAAGGFGYGFNTGFLADMARTQAGNTYLDLQKLRDKNGQPLDEWTMQGAALLSGIGTYLLGGVGAGAAGDAVSGLFNQALREAVTRPTVGRAVGNFATELAKGGLTGAAVNGGMELANIFAEQAAKTLSSGDFPTVFNDPTERQQAVDRLVESVVDGAALLGTFHALPAGASLFGDMLRARGATADVQAFTNLEQGVTDSKLRTRSASLFQDWLQRQTGGTPVENLFIPGERVRQLYQELGAEPGPDDRLFGFVPDIREQLEQADATGGDVVVPTADYLTHLAGTDVSNRLRDFIRVRQDGMSLDEGRQFEAERQAALDASGAELQRQHAEEQARLAPQQQIYGDVLGQARQAGFTLDTAQQYAALYAARYQARGERLGADPLELYRGEGLRIQQELPEALRPGPGDNLDLLLAALRSNRRAPSAREMFGPSLMEFLARRGGVEDVEGDLKAMGTDTWHRGKPGMRRFVRPPREDAGAAIPGMPRVEASNEYTPDAAARAAWEESYFPQPERPTVSDFYEAIRRELGGDPVYALRNTIRRPEDFEAAVRDLDETLGRLGVDPRTASSAEIRRVLQQFAESPEGAREFGQPGGTRAPPEAAGGLTGDREGSAGREGPEGAGGPSAGRETAALRGRISLADGRAIISLFEQRNLSTLLHETGHLWAEELLRDAEREDAPDQVRQDADAVRHWLGAQQGEALTAEQHEQFARGFEAYLMEGRAPSEGLRAAFQRFKAWLVSIYRTVASLRVSINPEIHGVFDRLLATDQEIAQVGARQGLRQLFRSADEAGMTDAEFRAYQDSVERARNNADGELLRKVMNDVRRRRTEAWRAEDATVRGDVTEAVDRRPEMQALRLLRTGTLPGAEGEPVRVRLSRDALVRMFDSDTVLDALPRSVPALYAEDGVHPDVVAEMVGMRSGDELVRSLIGLGEQQRILRERGDNRSVRSFEIDRETHARMVERHGEVLTDGSIEAEALDALHNERQGEALAAELRALSRTTQRAATPLQAARAWAQRVIAERYVGEAKPAQFARAEAKAGRAAERAMLAGDRDEVFRQKQAQLLNHALYIEARRAEEDVEKATSLLSRFARADTMKGMAQEYLDQIHDLIERFDFRPASQRTIERRKSLAAFVEQQRAAGHDVMIPDRLLSDAFRKHFSDLTVDDVRGLYDAVRNIAHLGRLKQTLLDGKAEREFDALVDEAVQTAGRLPQQTLPDQRNPGVGGRGLDRLRAKVQVAKHALKSLDASMLKMEQVLQWLDGGDSNGVFNRVVFRRLSDAQVREDDLTGRLAGQLRALNDRLPKQSRADLLRRYDVPELPDGRTGKSSSLLKSEVLSVALNTGNESNFAKLLEGERWSEQGVRAALDRLMTKPDWDFVQGVWDTIDSLWPDIEAMERRLTGVAPEKVEAREVQTRHGVYRGGYYPVIYDPLRAFDVEQNRQRSADQLFENNYVRATTQQGHTIERAENYARPLYLSLDVIPRHLNQVTHDLAFREAIMDADRFLAAPRVREAVEGALGREYYQQFRPWLQAIANDRAYDQRGLAWWDRLAHQARINATMVGLGFRLPTMALHGTSAALNSAAEVGAKPLARAVATFIRDPRGARDFVFEKSGEMRNRMNETDRDVRDGLRELLGQKGPLATARRGAFYGIAASDMASALPTWLARYTTALREGMTEDDAVYAADQSVRNAHGGGGIKDLAAIQRGSEFQKLFTMFYSFWNHLYNRQRDLFRDMRSVRSVGDFANVLSRSFFYLMAPPILHGLISQGGPDDDESWLGWAAEHIGAGLLSGIPVVRDIAGAATRGSDYQATPAERAIEQIGLTAKDAGRALGMIEGDPSDRWVKHAIETPGYVFGLPTGQASGAAQFLWDVWQGDEDPQGIQDWRRGLMYGPAPKGR